MLIDTLSQTFLFIRPTAANLAAYERWSGSEIQSHTWLGDMVDEVTKVDLSEGNTMIIPTGWIHAVVRRPLNPFVRSLLIPISLRPKMHSSSEAISSTRTTLHFVRVPRLEGYPTLIPSRT